MCGALPPRSTSVHQGGGFRVSGFSGRFPVGLNQGPRGRSCEKSVEKSAALVGQRFEGVSLPPLCGNCPLFSGHSRGTSGNSRGRCGRFCGLCRTANSRCVRCRGTLYSFLGMPGGSCGSGEGSGGPGPVSHGKRGGFRRKHPICRGSLAWACGKGRKDCGPGQNTRGSPPLVP